MSRNDDIFLRGDSELSEAESRTIEERIAEDQSSSHKVDSLASLQSTLAQSSPEPSERFVSDVMQKIQAQEGERAKGFSFGELFSQAHWLSGACTAALVIAFTSVVAPGADFIFPDSQSTTELALNTSTVESETSEIETLLFESDAGSQSLGSDTFLFSDYSEG